MEKRINLFGKYINLEVRLKKYEDKDLLPSQNEAISEFEGFDNISELEKYYLNSNEIFDGNVFSHIQPLYILVPRDEENKTLAIMCDCDIEPELGIAIIFKNGIFYSIDVQDEVL